MGRWRTHASSPQTEFRRGATPEQRPGRTEQHNAWSTRQLTSHRPECSVLTVFCLFSRGRVTSPSTSLLPSQHTSPHQRTTSDKAHEPPPKNRKTPQDDFLQRIFHPESVVQCSCTPCPLPVLAEISVLEFRDRTCQRFSRRLGAPSTEGW